MTEETVTHSASKGMIQGAVTFLDVLGWKGIWTREKKDQKAPIKALQGIIKTSRQNIDNLFLDFAEGKPRGNKAADVIRIESISDTIVILSNEISEKNNIEVSLKVHAALCKSIICQSIKSNIPMRGATCYGDYIASDEQIMIGPAIDEAASWHEMTEWIGVIMTPRTYIIANDTYDENWIKYNPPIKNAVIKDFKEMHCVDWTKEWIKSCQGDPRSELRKCFSEMGPLAPTVAQKYLNTLKYYDEINTTPKKKTGKKKKTKKKTGT